MSANGKERAAALLRDMQERLAAQELARYPRRSDFTAEEVVQIKAHLGPWPRALEAAGLKPPRDADGKRKQERRIAAKRRRTAAKIAEQSPDCRSYQDKGEKIS